MEKLEAGLLVLQIAFTGLIGIVAGIACSLVYTRNAFKMDQNGVKDNVTNAYISIIVGAVVAAASVWLIPWIISLFI